MKSRKAAVRAVLVCAVWAAVPGLSLAAPPTELDAVVREVVRVREAAQTGVLYGKFETDVEGPAAAFPLPESWHGERFRQRNILEWWVSGDRVVVSTSNASTCWLDGDVVQETPDTGTPRHTYVFDGERAYLTQTIDGQRELWINTKWPYANVAWPVLFGRSVSGRWMGEFMDAGGQCADVRSVDGTVCPVLVKALDHARVSVTLDPRLGYLCTEVVIEGDNGASVSRRYTFESTGDAVYPVSGVETVDRSDGHRVVTRWRTLEFDIDVPVPPAFFTPSHDDADMVADEASGLVLKGARRG